MTIDYDISGDPCPGLRLALHENAEAVLTALLEQRFPSLSKAERVHLAAFSGGNSRIALKIAEGAGEGVDLSKLNDSGLLDRLFRAERQLLDPPARICAEAAALVYAFYVEAADCQEPEHGVLAAIAEVSAETYYRNIATFLDWGIIQKRGPQRAVMPPPLANMLAARLIQRSDPSALLRDFLAASPRLLASFGRRLGQLHDEPAAVELARRLLAQGGAFAQLADHDKTMRQGFVNIAPAAPESVLEVFERALQGPRRKYLLDPQAAGHQDYCHVLVHIAHEQTLFPRAMEILLAFAMTVGDAREAPAARRHFLERFWSCLSFTLADQEARLAVIDRLLDDPSHAVREVGLDALDYMLEADHFSSSLDPAFGAKARLREWRPENGEGYTSWYRAAYDRLLRAASSDTTLQEQVRRIVPSHLRAHIKEGFADLAFEAMRRVGCSGYWDAGWRAAAKVLHFDNGKLAPKILLDAISLEKDLRPSTIAECFEAFVLGEPWRLWHPRRREKASTRNASQLATAVGVRASRSGDDIASLLTQATLAKHDSSAFYFGRGVALVANDIAAVWSIAYQAYRAAPTDRRNPGILAGILGAAHGRRPGWVAERLDSAITDPLLAEHIVALNCTVPIDEEALRRFEQALAMRMVPIWRFQRLASPRLLQAVESADLARFLLKLYESDGGTIIAIDILGMGVFGATKNITAIDTQILSLAREFLEDPRSYSEEIAPVAYNLLPIFKKVLSQEDGEYIVRSICKTVVSTASRSRSGFDNFHDSFMLLTQKSTRAVLDEILLPGTPDSLIESFFIGAARHDDDENKGTLGLDEGVLLAWMKEDPGYRACRLAQFIPYSVQNPDTGSLSWSPLALKLVDGSPHPVEVLRTFERRFGLGSGWGSFSARFVRHRPLATALLQHVDARVRNWARGAERSLDKSVALWDERDRARQSRFE